MIDLASFNEREKTILLKMHAFLVEFPHLEQIQEVELKTLIIDFIPLGFMMPTLKKMQENSLLARVDSNNNYGETAYELTDTGLSFADSLFDMVPLAVADEEVRNDIGWEPLPFEWDEKLLDAAEAAVEEALERVRGNNGFAASHAEEHKRLVWSLSTGLDALKRRVPSRAQIVEVLLKPLKWLAETFAKSVLGEVGKAAASSVARLIGLGS